MTAVAPKRQYSFTAHAVANPAAPPPGDRLDGEVDRTNSAIANVIDWVSQSLNTDGSLKASPQAVPFTIAGADPTALAQDWAEVSFEWAEHMPDIIPPNILATMGITGEHWSSRWWAHRALEIAQEVAAVAGVQTATVSDTAPAFPATGGLWWCSTDGQLYVFYDDGTSSQWVSAVNQPVTTAPAPANNLTPGSGTTVVLADARPVYINNAATLAALTIRMPIVPAGTIVEIGFRNPVTALSLQDSAGVAIPGAPASATGPGAAIEMRFEAEWIYWK